MRQSIVAVLSSLAFSAVAFAAPASTPELVAKGATLYKTNCAVCHGPSGHGDGPAGKSLKPAPRNFSTEKFKNGDKPDQVFATVSKGLPGTTMVGFGHIAENDRWAIVHFVETLRAAKK